MRRGYTLIELMIVVALLSLGAGLFIDHMQVYEEASEELIDREAIARVLDLELERLRACPDRACLEAQVETRAPEAESWLRVPVREALHPGPDGTVRAVVEVSAPSGPKTMEALLWVPE
jgi:prepilin-type N-terminal cleavage/methylation domain-containing protein